jgi:hypothetical protein
MALCSTNFTPMANKLNLPLAYTGLNAAIGHPFQTVTLSSYKQSSRIYSHAAWRIHSIRLEIVV